MKIQSLLSKTASHSVLFVAAGALSLNLTAAHAFEVEPRPFGYASGVEALQDTPLSPLYVAEAGAGAGSAAGASAAAGAGVGAAALALPLAAVAVAAAVAAGGSSATSTTSTETYNTTIDGVYGTEYNAQSGLAQISVLNLNDYGYTGAGIKVAVVDSGINAAHAEFSGRTINGSDYDSTDAYNYDQDPNGHGTHVASIIAGNRDATGMRGMAYDAELYSYNILDSTGAVTITDSGFSSFVNQQASAGIQVSNNSWGSSTLISSVSESTLRSVFADTITAHQNAINSGTLFVYAAGNDYGSEVGYVGGIPARIAERQSAWLVVGAVDANNKETAYTNRCGIAKDFCVVAPGGGDTEATDGIYAADTNGGYVRKSGTSMAAPHVSGLAALLMQKFPSLTNAEIATRIKTTSSLASLTGRNGETLAVNGEAAMQEIFGYGLVNGESASAAIASLKLVTGTNYYSTASHDVSDSKMQLPAGISASVRDAILADQFVVFDSFDGAAFAVSGADVFNAALGAADASTLSYAQDSDTSTGGANRVAFSSGETFNLNGMQISMTEGNSGVALTSSQYWGGKSGLIARPNFIAASDNVQQVEMRMNYSENLSLGTFIQTVNSGSSIDSGFGVSANWAATPSTVLH